MTEVKSTFSVLSAVNLSDKVAKKGDLTYLSWTDAWAAVKKLFPDAVYDVWKDANNLPYAYDPKTGYIVYTSVTIDGLTHTMWLPVMDSANRAMKQEPYEYSTFKWVQGAKKETIHTVDACTMYDINKTIMRCLCKNIAMFGLGLYIYAGEDVPDATRPPAPEEKEEGPKPQARALVALTIGSENWEKASHFITANKQLGFDKIVEQLKRKYTISAAVAKQITKLLE